MDEPVAPWGVIVLTGGSGRRLGGLDKASVELGEGRAIDQILDTLPATGTVVVAGPQIPTSRSVAFRPEDPRDGGPVAGIAAALEEMHEDITCVLAVDMPWAAHLLPHVVRALDHSATDVAVPVDADGRRQLLCSAWRTGWLRSALGRLPTPRDAPVRALLEGARVTEWQVPASLLDDLADIDTPEDLHRAQERATDVR